MTTIVQPHKRRRSTVACVNCHDRKVRCNAAFHGFPCSNCQQDRVACERYGRKQSLSSPRRPIRPRLLDEGNEALHLLTPSTQGIDALSDEAATSIKSQDGPSPVPRETQTPRGQAHDPAVAAHQQDEPPPQANPESNNVVPYYAGESEGLEFIFDICAPNRALKGTHYIVNKQVHKREHLQETLQQDPVPFPGPHLREELLQRYFCNVHPFLPLVDVQCFFHRYDRDLDSVSPLLLWSMFFAAANFADPETLKRNRFSSRKSFKEYCYQRAREIYDAQDEPDKTTLIQAAILLAFWYVDLEDRDGTWHWMGVAISLCHTIGLHRLGLSNFSRVPNSPFSSSQLAVWKRIWWCCYYREAFAALGLGRPMRINIDDCDLAVPTVEEVLVDTQQLSTAVLDKYLPPDRERLASQWIHLLHLSMHVEHMLVMHYRPRRPVLSLPQLEIDDADLWKLRESASLNTDHMPTTSLLHAHHLQCFFNTVIIALYRPYVLQAPPQLTSSEQDRLRSTAQQRVKDAAADTTAAINKLVSLDLIGLSSNMLVTAIMVAAQIHLFEIKTSEGLARQYASHHFNLHMVVLAQLRRTYWTADHQHKLFTETLKVIESGEFNGTQVPRSLKSPTTAHAAGDAAGETGPSRHDHGYANDPDPALECGGFSSAGGALEDFFLSFNPNPFISLPTDFDPGTPGEWVLGSGTPLNLDSSG